MIFGRIVVAAFVLPDGEIMLALNGLADEPTFKPLAVDLVSQFARRQRLTTTTYHLAITQPHRGIYKFSYPDAKVPELLSKHRKHMTRIKANVTRRVRTLGDFQQAVQKFVEHEMPG